MTDRRNEKYHDYYWILTDSIIDKSTGCEYEMGYIINENLQDFKIYQSQYLFESLNPLTRYVIQVVPEYMAKLQKNIEGYITTSDTVKVLAVYDINSISTWDVLWNLGVDMCLYQINIIESLTTNGFYVPLVWYIEKMQEIKKLNYIPPNIVYQILKYAIANNYLDIIQYVTCNIDTDLSMYGENDDIIIAFSKLISHQYVERDFCYYTVDYLLNHDFFKSIVNKELLTSMILTVLRTMGHTRTADLLVKYGFK